jgi:hypothetical protein
MARYRPFSIKDLSVNLIFTLREKTLPPVSFAAALYRLYPGKFQLDRTLSMIGSREVLRALKNGDDPRDIKHRWEPGLADFRRVRARYLLY